MAPVKDLLRGLDRVRAKRKEKEMKIEEEVKRFDKLVPKAALMHPQTWCVKRGYTVQTAFLKGSECVPCKHFVLRGGICDPL